MSDERVMRYDVAAGFTGAIASEMTTLDGYRRPVETIRADRPHQDDTTPIYAIKPRPDLWKTGRRWDQTRAQGQAPTPPQPPIRESVEEGDVGQSDPVAAARARMVARGANAWKTPKRASKRSCP